MAATGGHPGGGRPDTRENGYGQLSCHVGRAWDARAAHGAPHHHGRPDGCATARRRGFLGKAIALRVHVPDLSGGRIDPGAVDDIRLQRHPAPLSPDVRLRPAWTLRRDRPLRDQPPPRTRHGHVLVARARRAPLAGAAGDRGYRRHASGTVPALAVHRAIDLHRPVRQSAARLDRRLFARGADKRPKAGR